MRSLAAVDNDAKEEIGLVYGRISDDPLELERGIGKQLSDCDDVAAKRGVRVARVFQDNDISALTGKHRPGYEALLAAIAAGEGNVIICYQTSRLWRNRSERAAAIGFLAKYRVRIYAVKGPELDLSTAYGRGITGVLGEFDTMESEVKGERVAREALERAREGRANGVVLYGWRREQDFDDRGRRLGFRDVEDPARAAVVREIVDRLLSGDSLHLITRDLNRRGIPGPKSPAWGKTSVRKIALRPANVAIREYKGKVLGPAAWPAIVDKDKHARVVALLNEPERLSRRQRDSTRKHLFSCGIGECGVCGAPLRVKNSRHGHWLYTCTSSQGCVGRRQSNVDAMAETFILARLRETDIRAAFVMPDDTAARDAANAADAVRARLNTAADQYADDVITAEQLARITAKLKPELAQLEREARRALRPIEADMVGDLLDAPDIAERWRSFPVGHQYRILRLLGMRLRIMRTGQGGAGFNPDHVLIEWGHYPKDDADDDAA